MKDCKFQIKKCKYKCKGVEKGSQNFWKFCKQKKSEIFQEISRNFSEFVEKTVLIRKKGTDFRF